ncbi:MAG TPA: alkaline phosphatase family protein [Candidatus Tumulicola sp.]
MHIIRAIFAFAFVAALTACSSTITTPGTPHAIPSSNPTGSIRHVVILFQENRSFNTLFMGFPGAETNRAGACRRWKSSYGKVYCPENKPVTLRPILLESKCTGSSCTGQTDIAHQYSTFEIESDEDPATGVLRMDRFDAIRKGTTGLGPPAGLYPYGYVIPSETKAYWDMASQYTLADHMFSTEKSDSFPAHQELIAGTTALNDHESLVDSPSTTQWGCDAVPKSHTPVLFKDGRYVVNGPFPCFDQYKTIADVLDASNVSWKYYVQSISGKDKDLSGTLWNGFDAIKAVRYGPDWKKNIVHPNRRVIDDAAAGKLAAVSWVIPTLFDSDHPASACPNGPNWVSRVVNSIGESRDWKNTLILITWDEWGGWYDGVPPPQLDYTTLGMRVPLIIISPYAKKHYVSKTQYEFGSILKFIEQNFGTASLGSTDVRANSIGDALDFTQQPSAFKPIPVPPAQNCAHRSNSEIIEEEGGAPG